MQHLSIDITNGHTSNVEKKRLDTIPVSKRMVRAYWEGLAYMDGKTTKGSNWQTYYEKYYSYLFVWLTRNCSRKRRSWICHLSYKHRNRFVICNKPAYWNFVESLVWVRTSLFDELQVNATIHNTLFEWTGGSNSPRKSSMKKWSLMLTFL